MKLCKECRKEIKKYLKEVITQIEDCGYTHEYDRGYYDGLYNLRQRLIHGEE